MATLTWTPADGFTRKTQPVVKPTITEKPKPPPAQPSKVKRPKPSALKRQRAYWLRQNQLSPQDYTIADQYLVKQAKTATPMVFLSYGRAYPCTITKLWRYEIDLNLDGRKKRVHKLNLSLYYKAEDAPAVEAMLSFDASVVRERPAKKLSERDSVDLSAIDNGATVSLALRTGHRLTGSVRWVTAYDVGLALDNGAKVHVFKHAISCCQPQR